MRWRQGRRSTNVEDRRGGGGFRMPMGRGGGGLKVGGGFGILLLVLGLFFGQDLTSLLNPGAMGPPPVQSGPVSNAPASDLEGQFISTILADTEDVWTKLFSQAGERYIPPRLVLFTGQVQSACGHTSAAVGPFYCPGDSKVYIDLSFYRQLQSLGAGGDFSMAYVLAHEVGHHVQNLLGVSMAVQRKQRSVDKATANQLSVRAELQADCYAGVWAHHAHKDRQLLEDGDLEEGMNAAARIGDDALMAGAGRQIRPDAFTHGSSKQRQEWLYRGLQSGDAQNCDSFGT